jgi:hypothetical protein
MVSAKKEHKHKSRKAHKSEKHKSRPPSDSSSSSSRDDESSNKTRRRKRTHSEKEHSRAPEATASSRNALQLTALPQELRLLVNMLFAFPSLPPELVELLDALDTGESVCLDGVGDAALRLQLSEFLLGIGVRTDADVAATTGSQIFIPLQKVSATLQSMISCPT